MNNVLSDLIIYHHGDDHDHDHDCDVFTNTRMCYYYFYFYLYFYDDIQMILYLKVFKFTYL